MAVIQRVTCEYFEAEDRVRMSGEIDAATPIVIWLTFRLLQRLLPVLFPLLENGRADRYQADLLQTFAQQAAQSALQPQLPVQIQAASSVWLAHAVDIAPTERAVTLTFRSLDDQRASLTMEVLPLRQWLGIIHALYLRAGWPTGVWPEWVGDGAGAPPIGAAVMVVH